MPRIVTVTAAVANALTNVDTRPADGAAVRLAREYAHQLDQGGDLTKLGPQLLATLTALGMTPAARAALVKGGTSGPASSPLDELRARRAARQRDTPAVDTAAG